jgi:preprotein translocase subunit SecG
MRLLGLILSLGVICWVLYQAAGGGEAETAIPVEYQKSVTKAKGVEQTMQDAAQKSIEEAEKKSMP